MKHSDGKKPVFSHCVACISVIIQTLTIILLLLAALNAELSGTTSVITCLNGSSLTIAYAGDSAAIIGSKSNRRTPTQLTNPHDFGRP